MRTLFLTLLCLCASLAQAANYVTVTNTFTNRTVVGDSFTRSSTTVIFTNAPINNQAWIVTNSAQASATNLWRFLGRTAPSLYVRMADETNVVISGTDLQFSISGGFGYLTTNSANTTNQWFASLPFDVLTAANKTNQADAILDGLLKYPRTNAFPQNAQAMTNFVSRTNAQEVLNKKIGDSLLTNSTVDFSVLTNIPRANIGVLIGTNFYAFSGTISNVDLINVLSLSGTATALTNGTLYGTSATNGPWGSFTNLVALKSFAATNAILDQPIFTNAVGTHQGPVFISDVGTGVVVTMTNGPTADTPNLYFNSGSLSGTDLITFAHDNTLAWYIAGTTNLFTVTGTAGNVITLNASQGSIAVGSSAFYTDVPGRLESASGFIRVIVHSNHFAGSFSLQGGTVSTLVNGNNAGIILSTNPVVELSGATTIAQIAGFAASRDGDTRLLRFTGAITNWIVNEANSVFSTDGTAANRIVTGTGGDITQTNQPAWLKVRYRGTSSRWEVLDYSR
jgi:hypothetical protein